MDQQEEASVEPTAEEKIEVREASWPAHRHNLHLHLLPPSSPLLTPPLTRPSQMERKEEEKLKLKYPGVGRGLPGKPAGGADTPFSWDWSL